ncbi:MAG TPA: outer membrane protein assembly factor BamA, partial [Cytophagales bacterium]|nr:outer membrane protein assembly factor BamA [Cytophagales bacterium]
MKRILLCAVVLCVWMSEQAEAQFRNRTQTTTPQLNENNLNYAAPQEYTIAGIEVTGLSLLDKNAMVSLTGLKIGDKIKIPGDGISGAIRKLWKHGLIGDATISVQKIEGDQVFLVIALTERPRLNDFYFTGISKGRQSSLKEDLKLIRGKIVNDATIRNTELSVKKHFVKKGFLNTVVKVYQESDTLARGNVRLRIDVDLKTKVKINAIHIEGNHDVADGKLKKKLKKTHERPRFALHRALLAEAFAFRPGKIKPALDSSRNLTTLDVKEFINRHVKLNIFAGSKFIRSEFDADKLSLIEYYNSQGYRDAEILADTIVNFDKSNIDVKIKVYEGRKYYFRNITWVGNYIHSSNTLNKILDINKGDVYNNELLTKKTTFNPKGADISGLYMDDGYLFFQVRPIEVAVVGDSIDVEMRIHEGDQATIDEVFISGNERTNDHVIRRELSTIPGQKFRRSDLIRTQQMLSQMGYFNPQKIEQDIRPNPADGTVDIEWKVEEQSNDQIELSGGWGGFY